MSDRAATAVSLRPARPEDWPGIQELLQSESLPLAGVPDHLDDFIVATADRIVGCIGLERYGHAGLLRSLAVTSGKRGEGVGRALVEACVEFARSAGVDTLVLLTETAERYFERQGFARVDRARVPAAVHASAEFRGACPASAVAMTRVVPAAVLVRRAVGADLPGIVAIYNEGIRGRIATFETTERTAADMAPWLDSPADPILVAELDGRVVGWTRASEYRARTAYRGVREFSIYVAASARRRGVGTRLIEALVTECERLGHHKLVSRIFPDNLGSRALCRRHGFREVGIYERHGQRDGEWSDVVIVERLIGRAAR
jgi:phosphinothricin acetyltransferase